MSSYTVQNWRFLALEINFCPIQDPTQNTKSPTFLSVSCLRNTDFLLVIESQLPMLSCRPFLSFVLFSYLFLLFIMSLNWFIVPLPQKLTLHNICSYLTRWKLRVTPTESFLWFRLLPLNESKSSLYKYLFINCISIPFILVPP